MLEEGHQLAALFGDCVKLPALSSPQPLAERHGYEGPGGLRSAVWLWSSCGITRGCWGAGIAAQVNFSATYSSLL